MAKKRKIKIFNELREALGDAIAYERGEKVDLRTTELPAPPQKLNSKQIREIRIGLNVSQPVFASFLGVSEQAVQSWERGAREPQSSALRLLEIAKSHPQILTFNAHMKESGTLFATKTRRAGHREKKTSKYIVHV